jgi:hypothetical protein
MYVGVCELADIYEKQRKTLKRMSRTAGRFDAILIGTFAI